MKLLAGVLFLVAAGVGGAEVFRISEVVEAAGPGVERMVLAGTNAETGEKGEEALFVKEAAVVEAADVESAVYEPRSGGVIALTLNEAGGGRMKAATEGMIPGRGRLAVVMEGRVVAAPGVDESLGRSFQLRIDEVGARELDDLARKISGRPPRPEGEEPEPVIPVPEVKTVPFTEAEYLQMKRAREEYGIYHVEAIPAEAELEAAVRERLTEEEIIGRFGKPSDTLRRGEGNARICYDLAREKLPDRLDGEEAQPHGFDLEVAEGRLVRWSFTYTTGEREEKVVGAAAPAAPAKRTLHIPMPKFDFSADDATSMKFVESIVIRDWKQEIHRQDMVEMISIAMMMAGELHVDEDATVAADCDLVMALGHQFPEVAALRKDAAEGRVRVDRLIPALEGYLKGEKELPQGRQD